MVDDGDAHVLVVEDEQDLAELVELNMQLAGYEVSVARDGAAGLHAARDEDPDVILLDVMMPVLDGWQVLRALKEDPELSTIPVIMLTALAEERDIIRGHLQGAVRYVTKPFEMQVLLGAVEDALGEPDDAELAQRQGKIKSLLQRLAELDSGRSGTGGVRFSKLESAPEVDTGPPQPTPTELERLDDLTEKQRELAERLAAGLTAREIADELDVSRSNVYATRKRIARKLEVESGEVAAEARRLGLGDQDEPDEPDEPDEQDEPEDPGG